MNDNNVTKIGVLSPALAKFSGVAITWPRSKQKPIFEQTNTGEWSSLQIIIKISAKIGSAGPQDINFCDLELMISALKFETLLKSTWSMQTLV